MRLVKYFVACSLDGYISRKEGSVDWLFSSIQDDGMSNSFPGGYGGDGPQDVYQGKGIVPARSELPWNENIRFLTFCPQESRRTLKLFYSRTGVKAIRATEGKDIWLVGGGEMVREFLQKKLVNEIGISIHPRLLGMEFRCFAQPYPSRSRN